MVSTRANTPSKVKEEISIEYNSKERPTPRKYSSKSQSYYKKVWKAYQNAMITWPVLMNQTQSAIITAAAVVSSQYIFKTIDLVEMYAMVIVTIMLITPVLLKFYSILPKLKLSVLQMLVLDQFMLSPVFNGMIIASRFYVLKLLKHEGEINMDNMTILTTTMNILPMAVGVSWIFWIPQRYITFKYVPPVFQQVFGTICSFFWNLILAYLL